MSLKTLTGCIEDHVVELAAYIAVSILIPELVLLRLVRFGPHHHLGTLGRVSLINVQAQAVEVTDYVEVFGGPVNGQNMHQ